MDSKRLALDASAFYAGVPFGTTLGRTSYITTQSIYDEISHIKKRHDALGALVATKRLLIIEPAQSSIDAARVAARSTGDMPNLSEQDISILALCLEQKTDLITDDYAVSNVMHSAKLDTVPIMTGGIRQQIQWMYYCPGCGFSNDACGGNNVNSTNNEKHYKYSSRRRGSAGSRTPNTMECPICGTAMRRRPSKKKRVRAG